ncbi:hypothetical protein Acr_16g0002950 [Actinidia rufa]|uniref:Uncharacterized protein n=1 Tax=Actinidia rufa TaxID=165716 RepID=A0A7J0FY98_9ERIC|nr:hypothetical protein Acr_16g0002950 [Actinidia rufa]
MRERERGDKGRNWDGGGMERCGREANGVASVLGEGGWKAMAGEGAGKAAQGWEVAGGGRKDMRGAAVVGQ